MAPSEETRLSNDASGARFFERRQPNPLEYSTPSTTLHMYGILGQASPPTSFESFFAEIYSIPTTLDVGNEILTTSGRIANLGETVLPVFSSTSSAASPTAIAGAQIFDTSFGETRTLPLIQPNDNLHHESLLRIILGDGRETLEQIMASRCLQAVGADLCQRRQPRVLRKLEGKRLSAMSQ
jgi:hypothetical protein